MALILLLILIPAPKDEPLPFIGLWDVKWGSCEQTMEFLPDGRYLCPRLGNGTWTYNEGVVYFTEGEVAYYMVIDWREKRGLGYKYDVAVGWEVYMKRKVK